MHLLLTKNPACREEKKPAGSVFLSLRYYVHDKEKDAITDLRTRVCACLLLHSSGGLSAARGSICCKLSELVAVSSPQC